MTVAGDPYELPGGGDFVFQVGVVTEDKIEWFDWKIVDASGDSSGEYWREFRYPLGAYRGQEVGLVIKIAGGGRRGKWANEEAFLDEFSVYTEAP